MRRALVGFALVAVFCGFGTGSALAARRVALVVGNSGYESVTALTNPVNDAAAVSHPLAGVKRASYIEAKHGLFKIVYDRGTRRVLGLHVVSRNASDIVQGLAVAISLGATVDDLAHAHHTFPTFGEGVKAAAEKAPS